MTETNPNAPSAKPSKPRTSKPAKPASASKPTKTTKVRKPKKPAEPKQPKAPRITNGERLAKLAEQPEGFSLDDVTTMLGIQPHTARALISVELRKKRGINIVSKGGHYTVAPAA
jgi:hypothetical protein